MEYEVKVCDLAGTVIYSTRIKLDDMYASDNNTVKGRQAILEVADDIMAGLD